MNDYLWPIAQGYRVDSHIWQPLIHCSLYSKYLYIEVVVENESPNNWYSTSLMWWTAQTISRNTWLACSFLPFSDGHGRHLVMSCPVRRCEKRVLRLAGDRSSGYPNNNVQWLNSDLLIALAGGARTRTVYFPPQVDWVCLITNNNSLDDPLSDR